MKKPTPRHIIIKLHNQTINNKKKILKVARGGEHVVSRGTGYSDHRYFRKKCKPESNKATSLTN